MPPLETTERNAWAVLWVKTGNDARGEPLLADPVELQVRWERSSGGGYGMMENLNPYVGTLVLDRSIPDGSIVYLGTLEEWYGRGSGSQPNAMLYQTGLYDEVPDIKGREIRQECRLARFRGSLGGN